MNINHHFNHQLSITKDRQPSLTTCHRCCAAEVVVGIPDHVEGEVPVAWIVAEQRHENVEKELQERSIAQLPLNPIEVEK